MPLGDNGEECLPCDGPHLRCTPPPLPHVLSALHSKMIKDTIRRVNGYQRDAYTYYPVVIVGAGASGIAMACQLKQQLGFDQFRVFDRQAGIGGTWWINRYPGVAW